MSALAKISASVRAAVDNLPGRRAGSAKIESALNEAHEMARLAAEEIRAAEEDHAEAVRQFDRDRGLAALARKAASEFDRDAACAAIARLESEAHDETYREDQERRRSAYAKAEKELATAERHILKAYPELASGIVKIIEQLAISEGLTAIVNADLPDGKLPLLSLQERLLSHSFPREEISNVRVSRWVFDGSFELVAEEFQGLVIDRGNGAGILPYVPAGPYAKAVGEGRTVVRRDFWKVTFLPHQAGHSSDDAFASRIALPGLAHQAPHWTPSHDDRSEVVLAHLSAVRAEQRRMAEVEQRRAVVEFVPVNTSAAAEA